MHSWMLVHVGLNKLRQATCCHQTRLKTCLPSAWWNWVFQDIYDIINTSSSALIPVSKQLRRKNNKIYSIENIYILYALSKWVKGTVMRNATFFPQSLKGAIPSLKTIPSYLPQVSHATCLCVRPQFLQQHAYQSPNSYTTWIPKIRNTCASPNVYGKKKATERGNCPTRASHSSNIKVLK